MIAFTQTQCSQCAAQVATHVPDHISVQVHPLPPFDSNLTAFNHMVDKTEELGLWLMYEFAG